MARRSLHRHVIKLAAATLVALAMGVNIVLAQLAVDTTNVVKLFKTR